MTQPGPIPPAKPAIDRLTDWLKSATGLITTITALGAAIVAFAAFASGIFTPPPPTPAPFTPRSNGSVEAGVSIADWAAAADEACAETTSMFTTANQLARSDMASGLDATSDAAFTLAARLRSIDQPTSRAADVERYISRWEEGGRAMADAADAVRDGNMAGLDAAAARYGQALDGGAEIARGVGAQKCALLATD
jgi:hypothetical protein